MIKKILTAIALFAGTLVLMMTSLFLGIELFEGSSLFWGILARVCALGILGALIAMSIVSWVKAGRFRDKRFSTAQDMYDGFMAYRESITERYEESKRRMDALAKESLCRIASFILLVQLFLLFATASIAYSLDILAIILVCVAGLYCPIVSVMLVARYIDSLPTVRFSEYEREEDYPEIYALARSAADRMGIDKDIKITYIGENTVGVALINNKISLQIGAPVLAYLTKEEMYPIFLHEFSHIRDESRESKINRSLSDFFGAMQYTLDMALLYTGQNFCFEYEMYKTFSNIMVEQQADRSMALDGNAQNAANSLAKIAVYEDFSDALDINMGGSFYENEENLKHVCSVQLDRFFELLPEKRGEWEHRINCQIRSRSATHPIVRERIQALGVTSYDTSPPDDEGSSWREECKKLFSAIDEDVYQSRKDGYDSAREQYYLEPKSKIDAWIAEGREYSSETVRGILDALTSICRWDEALELCDLIVARETGGLRDYAHHVRGYIYYLRRDVRAIPDLYAAVEGNTNYTEDINLIGDLCCNLGLHDELETYRERAVGIIQKQMDSSGMDELLPSDDLKPADTLPEEIFKRNLEFIIRSGEGRIKRVFLVEKSVSEGISSYVYVIEFDKRSTEYDGMRKSMDAIFEHLDNSPEDIQYSLFLYDREHARAVKKVSGSCIFDIMKEENQ